MIWKSDLNSDPRFTCFAQIQLPFPPTWEKPCPGKTDSVAFIVADTHWPGHRVLAQGWKKGKAQLHSGWFFFFFGSVTACWGSCNRCTHRQSQDWQVFQRSRWWYSAIDSLIRVWYYWTSTWLKGICKRFSTESDCGQENVSCKLVCITISALRV